MNDFSELMFARPSFTEGVARTLDMGGTFTQYNTSPTQEDADMAALYADWQSVGDDLHRAMSRFAAQYELDALDKADR